jgi:hypothetical protein
LTNELVVRQSVGNNMSTGSRRHCWDRHQVKTGKAIGDREISTYSSEL